MAHTETDKSKRYEQRELPKSLHMDESTLDTMLIPHYLGERALAVPTENRAIKRSLDLVVDGRLPEVPYRIKKAQFDWLSKGGIINEVSAMDAEGIAALACTERVRYLQALGCKDDRSLSDLREELHRRRGVGFAMDVQPLIDNPRDSLTVHRRVFLIGVALPSYGADLLKEADDRLRAASPLTMVDAVKSILVSYLHASGASLCGIVFNNGACLSAVDATLPRLLQNYESRMKVNKRRLAAGKLGYSFGFAQYCGLACEKISIAHNKAGEFGVGSFIKSPFRGGDTPYFSRSDFRLVYGFPKAIELGEVMLNDALGHVIARALNQYDSQTIEALMEEDDSVMALRDSANHRAFAMEAARI